MYGVHDRSKCPASSIAGHLKHSESHVTANPERDAEPNATEKCQLEPSGTA